MEALLGTLEQLWGACSERLAETGPSGRWCRGVLGCVVLGIEAVGLMDLLGEQQVPQRLPWQRQVLRHCAPRLR